MTVSDVCRRLGVQRADARYVMRLLAFARAHGEAGRWPDQNFGSDPRWQAEGYLLDRIAMLTGARDRDLFELYRESHADGLETWRKRTN